MIFYKSIFIILLACFCYTAFAQQTGFTAIIGVREFAVKNGDTLHVCRGGTIIYASTAINYSTLEWRVDNEIVETLVADTFSVTYNELGSGFYTVQTLNKGTNSADSLKIFVEVSTAKTGLKAIFDYNPKTLQCGSDRMSFDGTESAGTGLSYYWDYGDNGFHDTTSMTSHWFFTAIGTSGTSTFPVKLIVTNHDGCSDSVIQNITVKRIPDAILNTNDPTIDKITFEGSRTFRKCDSVPQYAFGFTNVSSTRTSNILYKITWGSGTPAVTTLTSFPPDSAILHEYPLGTSKLSMEITGQNGCKNTAQYKVFLGLNATGGFEQIAQTEYCSGNMVSFPIDAITKQNPSGTLYTFHVNDNTKDTTFTDVPTVINHVFPFSSCGYTDSAGNKNSFFTSLTIENPCQTKVYYINKIHVTERPKAKFTLDPDSSGCINTTFTCINTSVPGNEVSVSGECSSAANQVWKIEPADGFTLTAGTDTGSVNGSVSNPLGWRLGSPGLNIKCNRAGTWKITLYTSSSAGSACTFIDSTTHIICTQSPPDASFSVLSSDNNRCFGDTLILSSALPSAGCLTNSYAWVVTKTDPAGCSVANPVFLEGTDSTSPNPKIWLNGAGSYSLLLKTSVPQATGCEASSTHVWNIKDNPRTHLNTPVSVCAGTGFQPSADTTGCYGSTAISYLWQFPGSTTPVISGYSSGMVLYATGGTYSYILSSQNECGMYSDTTSVLIYPRPDANAGNNIELCDGDIATIGVNTGNYSYSWTPSTGLSNANIATPTVMLPYTSTSADTIFYTLHVRGDHACDSSATVKVVVKPKPYVTVNADKLSICKFSSAVIQASGADLYSWTPSAGITPDTGAIVTVSPLISTVYTVTGTSANGCSAGQSFYVAVATEIPVAEAGQPDSVCSGSSINIGTNTGAYAYNWQPAEDFINPNTAVATLSPTGYTKDTVIKYTLTVLSSNGCSATDSVHVKVKRSPALLVKPDTSVDICTGQSISLSAAGADTYSWSPATSLNTTNGPTVIATPASTTNYILTGALQNSCETKQVVTVTPHPGAIAAFSPGSYHNCAPFTVDTIITIEDHFNENSTYIWHIRYHKQETIQSFSTAQAPDFTLQNPGDSVEIYLITISRYSCSNDTTLPIVIKTDIIPEAHFTKTSNGGCEPVEITYLNRSNALDSTLQFVWQFGNGSNSSDIQPPPVTYTSGIEKRDTTYYIQLTASNRCAIDIFRDSVRLLPTPAAGISINNESPRCSPYPALLNNTSYGNPISFTWNFGDGTTLSTSSDSSVHHLFTTNTLDTFGVKLIARNNCGEDDTTLLLPVIPDHINVNVEAIGNSLFSCAQDKVKFLNTTTNALTNVWSYGDGTEDSLAANADTVTHIYAAAGNYTVAIRFDNGCVTASDSKQVKIYELPRADFSIVNPLNKVVCLSDSININISQQTGDSNNLYWGDNNEVYNPPVTSHLYDYEGRYLIRLTAEKKYTERTCFATDSSYVNVVAKPTVSVTQPPVIDCFTDSAILQASGGVSYTWLPAESLDNNYIASPVASPSETTLYTVNITSDKGCVQQRSTMVRVDRTAGTNPFQMPSAFTPNGDGVNDCFKVKFKTEVNNYSLRIFSRWGKPLFESHNIGECWNGNFNHTAMPTDTYIYILELQSSCAPGGLKEIFRRTGTLTLIR